MRCIPRKLQVDFPLLACALLACALSSRAEEGAEAGKSSPRPEIVVGSPERIEVFPSPIRLDGRRRRMHLIVTGIYGEGQLRDLTHAAEFVSTNRQVIDLDGHMALPAGNGSVDVLVRVGGHELAVPAEVTSFARHSPVSFQYDTLPILTRHGCNAGACHGSPSGKGGFRLSLQAYDPQLDQLTLIREAYGRRTNTLRPDASLLLLKPTMQISHGGGMRLRKNDVTYQLLEEWIAEGCQVDAPDAPSCVRVEVFPGSGRVLKQPAHTQQLLVLAHFSDGSVRDVTHLAKFSSSDEAVASVGNDGLVVGKDRGEVAVMVRYLEKVETCFITFVTEIEGFQWTQPPEVNYIDRLVYKKLRQLKFLPSDLCTDEEFIRRVYLDVIGRLPPIPHVVAFLADRSAEKRAKLIDHLLDQKGHAQFWALKWGDLLRLKGDKVAPAGVHKYYQWLVRVFENNMPHDQFCRELLTAQGSTFTNPPANYFRVVEDFFGCTETTAQLFLGVRIQCAKCHNHPFERWTQDNYYGLAAFFNRVQRKKTPRADEMVIWTARHGEVIQPRTGKQMKPWLPVDGEVEQDDGHDRRQTLVDWLVRPDNPFFAKVTVNRLWAHVMGSGIVEPVDDFRDSNPPSSAQLLDALAVDFVRSQFDRQHILRTILNSRVYQLSARTNPFNKDDTKYFSHAQVRMLGAEQLLDAICHVTGVAEQFQGYPAGTRAVELASPDVNNEFLKVFGRPDRATACACERGTESSLAQALQLFNSPVIHEKLTDKENRLQKLMDAGKSDEEIVTELHLAAVCREPTDGEIRSATEYIAEKENRFEALQDICWALLNTNEFLFQH